jgi:uncharacterized membrane protein YtjA (UPF0391 family)
MSNEDRLDVARLADDGCPNVSGDTQTIDVAELLAAAPAGNPDGGRTVRLSHTLLLFALVTGAVGFGGLVGGAADYFRILCGVFAVMSGCLLFGRRARAGKAAAL